MMKKIKNNMILLILVCIAVLFIVTSCSSSNNANTIESDKIKIGVAVPMTGGSAELGSRVFNGAKLAADEINEAGGINGKMIELVSMDDRADPKEAANIANLLVADKEIIAVIGGYNSSCTLASAPIYNSNKLPQIAVGPSSPKVSDAGEYTFRVWNSDTYRASFDLQIILDEGYNKIGIVYQNDDFGVGALNISKEILAKEGLEPLVAEGYLLGETKDFNTIITKMKNANCDSVFAISDESEFAAFCKQCEQQGFRPFISCTGTYNPAVITLGGSAVEGAVGDAFADLINGTEKAEKFFKNYNEKYSLSADNGVQDPTSPCAYDALNMIAEAIKNGAESREEVQRYLANLKDFDGVVGKLSFDENGDVNIPLAAIVIKDGDFQLLK